jgi:glyoxylase-like metal-dependent hydrolase (beta-lactamase superfamily II)
VVDPGGDLDRIEAAIGKIGLTVEKILLTHGHIDHAGGAAEFKEGHGGLPIEGPHAADKFLLDGLAEQGTAFGLSGARNVTPDRWLAEGDTVAAAGATFSVLHCPGHSPGSVVLFNAPQRFAGGRRTISRLDRAHRFSVRRPRCYRRHQDQAAAARRRRRLHLRHGPMSTLGDERKSNPFIA